MSQTLRSSVLRIASGLPVGEPVRRKLLGVLKAAGHLDEVWEDLEFRRVKWSGKMRTRTPDGGTIETPKEGRIRFRATVSEDELLELESGRAEVELTDRQQDDLYGQIPVRGEREGDTWMAIIYASPGYAEVTKVEEGVEDDWPYFVVEGYVDATVYVEIDQ